MVFAFELFDRIYLVKLTVNMLIDYILLQYIDFNNYIVYS